MQHKVVLGVMREGAAQVAAAGDLTLRGRALASGLDSQTRAKHDAALALHRCHAGFDPATGVVNRPGVLPQTLIGSGCAGTSCCSDHSAVPGRCRKTPWSEWCRVGLTADHQLKKAA
jgi:hypothetical protein